MVLINVKIQDKNLFWFQVKSDVKVFDAFQQIILIQYDHYALLNLLEVLNSESLHVNRDESGKDFLDSEMRPKFDKNLLVLIEEIKDFVGQKLYENGACITAKDSSALLARANEVLKEVFSPSLPHDLDDILKKPPSNAHSLQNTSLFFAGKEMIPEKFLFDYFGKNEKTKVVVKLHRKNSGPPVQESGMSEQQQKDLMLRTLQRHHEIQRLEEDDGISAPSRQPAETLSLRRTFQGLPSNITWKPE